jgi:serine protease Do
MEKRRAFLFTLMLLALFFVQACGFFTIEIPRPRLPGQPRLEETAAPAQLPTPQPPPAVPAEPGPPVRSEQVAPPALTGLLEAYQGALEAVYERVNPSVVNIRVLSRTSTMFPNLPEDHPFFTPPSTPGADTPEDFFSQGVGSGFVWDQQGHIVTNNHVVAGADKLEVTFFDGTILVAELVGADAYTDIAVLKVNAPDGWLVPVVMGDSSDVKVGQLAVAIGNPFGLNGTMTTGIISALGRSLPVEGAASYLIPDIVQTDAPINPGNSGGVLVNISGEVIGITAAIESPSQANAGIGFAIPAAIVDRVVPSLVEKGLYDHPWLGISGRPLTPEVNEAMGLDPGQRGALIVEVISGTPAEKAGLKGGNRVVRVESRNLFIGGDVVVAIDGSTIRSMEDVIAYLARYGVVGQPVTLEILRGGEQISVEVTLGARPAFNTP